MATIVTRTGKGSALTFAEGDANFTNLNNDKLENINSESIADLSDVNFSSGQFGTASSVDDVRNPNTITLTGVSISTNTRIRFTGADVTSKGLAVNTDYYIAADIGANAYELSTTQNGGADVNITNAGSFGDINYQTFGSATLADGDILTYDGTTSKWIAEPPAAAGGGGIDVVVISWGGWVETGGTNKSQPTIDFDNSGIATTQNTYEFTLPSGTYITTASQETTTSSNPSISQGVDLTSVSGDATITDFYKTFKSDSGTNKWLIFLDNNVLTLTQPSTFYLNGWGSADFYGDPRPGKLVLLKVS